MSKPHKKNIGVETRVERAKQAYLEYQPHELSAQCDTVDGSIHLYLVLVFKHDAELHEFREQYGLPHRIFQDARAVRARLDPAYRAPKKLKPVPPPDPDVARRIGPDQDVIGEIEEATAEIAQRLESDA